MAVDESETIDGNKSHRIAAAFIGASLPAILSGRATLAVVMAPGLAIFLWSAIRTGSLRELKSSLSGMLGIGAIMMVLSWIPGTVVGLSFFIAARTIVMMVSLMFAAWLIWLSLRDDRRALAVLLKSLVVTYVVLGVVAMLGLFFMPEVVRLLHGRLDGNTALLMKESASGGLIMLPVMLYAGWRLRGAWLAASLASVILVVTFMIMTDSRSALAGLIAEGMMVVLILLLTKVSFRIRVISGIVAVVLALGVFSFLHITRADRPEHPGGMHWPFPIWLIDAHRQTIWMFTWQHTKDARLFGVGPYLADRLPGADQSNNIIDRENVPVHPHNWLLEVLAETGYVGLFFTLVAINMFWLRCLHRIMIEGPSPLVPVMVVWAGFWVSAMFNFSIWTAWWQISFMVLTAVCMAAYHQWNGKSPA